MTNRKHFKFLATTMLALSLAWLPQPAMAQGNNQASWLQDSTFQAISNNLVACYNAICLRYLAAGWPTNSVPVPAFNCPYQDYLSLGGAIDTICGSYLVQTNAAGNGCFDVWLAANPTNGLPPCWIATNLHVYCGFTNWGNDSPLTSWDCCDHSVATQVVQACNALCMTAMAATPVSPYNNYTNIVFWMGTNWSSIVANPAVGGGTWPQGTLVIDNNTNITATRVCGLIEISGVCFTGAVSSRTIYLEGRPVCSTWMTEGYVGTLYSNYYASVYTVSSSDTNSVLDTFLQGDGIIPFDNQGGPGTSEGWAVGSGFWAIDWQFTPVPDPQLLDVAPCSGIGRYGTCSKVATRTRKHLSGCPASRRRRGIFNMGQLTTLAAIISSLRTFDAEDTIYAAEPWSMNTPAIVMREPEGGGLPNEAQARELKYFLEVFVVRDFLEDWKSSLNKEPTLDETCARVIQYAIHDA